ncbi:hypothetical protein CK203_035381 [Vitis vinifera]|uniref:Uncharacterized protein n=1 Tax=Vitis vinifera TaxID=29760 RepID=A0A438I3P7_VITVI|nr:hypothetical protein CK203_035381 [Vitis vinifera]
MTTTKNLSISAIFGNDTSTSWDLIFRYNLTNVEIEDLERLMSLLSHVHLTPSILDVKVWVPSSSGVPSKFMAFVWSSETVDNLFLHYPITLGLWHRIFSQAGIAWVQ